MTLEALAALADTLADDANPQRGLLHLVTAARTQLGVDRAGVFMLDRVTQRLERLVGIATDGAPEYEGEAYPIDGQDMPLTAVARRELPYYFSEDAPTDYPQFQFQSGVRALAVIPILAGGQFQGALCVDNALSGRTLPTELLASLKVFASLAALPLFALHQRQERERMEAVRRGIYRQVLLAVTGGKFHLCESKDLASEWPALDLPLIIKEDRDIGSVREAVRNAAHEAGLSEERSADFTLSVCEAATNALLHGKGGQAVVAYDKEHLRFRIQDNGEGIHPDDIPSATLVKGWSKRASLGLGFTIINEMADRVYMSTGSQGTSLILEMDIVAPAIYGLGADAARWADALV
jgi:anti-sigma regulatory factor (Ser/Thr protein kinase)